MPEAVIKAMDEAARIINDDPRRAAAIYLAHEPSKTLDARAPVAVVSDTKEAVGSTLQGVAAFAEFMGATASSKMQLEGYPRTGALKFAEHVAARTGFADNAPSLCRFDCRTHRISV